MIKNFKLLLMLFLALQLGCKKADNSDSLVSSQSEISDSTVLIAEGRAFCNSCYATASIAGTTTKYRTTAQGLKSFSQLLTLGKSICSSAVTSSGSTYPNCLSWEKVINGKLKFSDYDKLKSIINTPTNQQAHHIVPRQLCDAFGGNQSDIHPVIQKAGMDGFQPNDAYNGVSLPTTVHNGPHANYTEWVRFQLTTYNTNNSNSSLRDANTWVQTKLIPALRSRINNAVTLSQPLGTYFGTLPLTYIGN